MNLQLHNSFTGAYDTTEFQGCSINYIKPLAEIKSLYSLEELTILKRIDSHSLSDPLKSRNFIFFKAF